MHRIGRALREWLAQRSWVMGGPGYYAAIMGHAVGSEGKVYLQNNQFALERFWKAAYDEHFANGGRQELHTQPPPSTSMGRSGTGG